MKCPVRKTMNTTTPGELTFTQDDCLTEECAWWDKVNQTCAILTMAQAAIYTHKALVRIDTKIPLGILK